jgi:DtxR family transcriptional regulator, Mn-dependent transcriptional regulator
MSDLIDTTQMYLRTVFELEEEGILALRARIAERLGHSGPTVSQTIARMERDGLVQLAGDRHIELTESGRQEAIRVMRKHRLVECLLVNIIELPWHLVHEEACRWEHVVSEDVERRIVAMLNGPTESPYGNPIPGLSELGLEELSELGLDGRLDAAGKPLTEFVDDDAHDFHLHRIGESLQSKETLLMSLMDAEVRPDATFTAARSGSGISITHSSGRIHLTHDEASHLFVTQA